MHVAVFGSSATAPDDPLFAEGMRLGRALAEARFVVATGGYDGIMAAVSRGAAEAGGHVVGVTAPGVFPHRPGANGWVAEERPGRTLTERIGLLVDDALAVVALPGSIGTLTEILVTWNENHIRVATGLAPIPTLVVGADWVAVVGDLLGRFPTKPPPIDSVPVVDDAIRWLAHLQAPV